eukprot:TRINITY_DN20644_c0_g1_i1.p1 TRINITY_DN20644_c0_g1~~TRINITY_DN20644_c0_g1_i1.p1  ORF type:complete len:902 (-),score=169.07 TRINITY_DN20644_c0_g1_i1:931-3636(-)
MLTHQVSKHNSPRSSVIFRKYRKGSGKPSPRQATTPSDTSAGNQNVLYRFPIRCWRRQDKYNVDTPSIKAQFASLKRDLSKVSQGEWETIPEIGDYSLRYKRRQPERFVPVPDSLLEKARQEQSVSNTITPQSGLETPATPILTDLTKIGSQRGTVLGSRLDKLGDDIKGKTVVDPKGFLTSLEAKKVASAEEVGDAKKARLLLKSVTTTNPHHAPGWIAAARLEEYAGKLAMARAIAAQGCKACPTSEDVWLEAARLQTPENAKNVLANAIKQIPSSVKIWIAAANLEADLISKKRVLRRGLEFIPNSVRLWKEAIELEEHGDARIMLARAVECVPQSVDMWLALARLETYENAQAVLNKAREAIPTEPAIWIMAAKLEEANGHYDRIDRIIRKAIKSLAAHQVVIDRQQWLKEAENTEKSGSVATCQALVRETVGLGVEDVDRKHTWVEDAEQALHNGAIECARAIFAHAATVFPGKKSIWLRAAHLEKQYGSPETLLKILEKAVKYCPKSEVLWLMAAKENWLAGNVDSARRILNEAFAANPDSEEIWLAAVKLEWENNEMERAHILLQKAREKSGTQRVWMKAAKLEREMGCMDECRAILEEALQIYPKFDKLWMMRAQLEETCGSIEKSCELYLQGLAECPNAVPLWLCAANFEVRRRGLTKARALLEKARLSNPKSDDLFLASVRVELQAKNVTFAQAIMAKALQTCPTSGKLWSEAILMEPRPQQRTRSIDALKRCEADPLVITTVATLFWQDRKIDKARRWFDRAVTLNPDLGDSWAAFYKFEVQHGTEGQQREIIRRCVEADPHHGDKWCSISKAVENSRMTTEQVLKQVAVQIQTRNTHIRAHDAWTGGTLSRSHHPENPGGRTRPCTLARPPPELDPHLLFAPSLPTAPE